MTRVPQFYDWPLDPAEIPTPAELEKVYSDGFPGCQLSAWSQESLFEDGIISQHEFESKKREILNRM